jgi:hypothetical protein
MNKVNIRVYKRGYKGTILIWNTDPLTEDQRKNAKIFIRPEGVESWIEPQTGMPDTVRMGKIMDGKTDTVTVIHDDNFTADTPFSVKIEFGEGVESVLDVEPKNQHKAYVKTERYQLANGQFIYADPAYVIGLHPVVIDDLRKVIIEEVRKAMVKT